MPQPQQVNSGICDLIPNLITAHQQPTHTAGLEFVQALANTRIREQCERCSRQLLHRTRSGRAIHQSQNSYSRAKSETAYWSTAAPSARYRQRCLSVQTGGPRLHRLVIDHTAGVNIEQRFTGKPTAFFFLVQPGRQGLFHYPLFRTLQALGDFIDALRELNRDMCGH